MTIRPQFKTYKGQRVPQLPSGPKPTIEATEFSLGLIKDLDPEILPPNALQTATNSIYIKNRLLRRNGLNPYSISKPNSNSIVAIWAYFDSVNGVSLFRLTGTTIYRATSTGWVAFTGPALVPIPGESFYYFTVADGRAFFTNNGGNTITELLPGSSTYAALGNAPAYKYITSAFDRIIGANLSNSLEYQIGWSGELNYEEWDESVDISAGETPLVDSPSDLSDAITGLFNLTSLLCIPRERSIWLATKLPSATNPFNFFPAVARIGCDCPQTIAIAGGGIIFYNFQNSSVYFYTPGMPEPVELSMQIKRQLKSDISSPLDLFASYNYDIKVYSLFILTNTSLVKNYNYHFTEKNWTYHEYMNVSCVSDLDYASSQLSIDDLSGTIANLLGTINELGGLVANANRFFGFNTGDISTQPFFSAIPGEVIDIILTDNGTAFTQTVDSKTLINQSLDTYWDKISIGYTPFTVGTITLEYSKDDGNTFTTWKSVTVVVDQLNISQVLVSIHPVRARKLFWRITSSDCMFALNNFKCWNEPAGIATT